MSTDRSVPPTHTGLTGTGPAPLPAVSREVRLAARPVGTPVPQDFELADAAVPALAEGQVLVRNTWMSVDPYMRGRMDDAPSYMAPFALGAALEGSAVGEVVASRSASVPVGATVSHFLGWREYAVLDGAAATVVDVSAAAPEDYLGALGATGLTAYAALTRTAPVREGDVVFVSAAAGAVGSIAGQVARQLGAARVIGSARGPHKTKKLLDVFGYDAALDRHRGDLSGQLERAAPDGIDVYLDAVGGDHLRAAIAAIRPGGRIAMVGAISGYDATGPVPGPDNLFRAAAQEATLRGMLVTSHLDLFPEWIAKAAGLLADGTLRTEKTVVDGIEHAADALLGVLGGANTGKMLVRLGIAAR
ncbi:Putative NADP-dependent oxidoreductase YfmJ [Streptomyces lavendulae subsp. lavendulae]|uniref:NADP-dependent oxidoreductase YfmJ n=1 Tax=Streptomyces lavendulae subsp. lavendulae TaxID=58340 RepID=A0A2K8PQE0_STRLA|nr:NADP-dependent oxidoreductase [Streptomyces lavendulae]ATZ28944.1 Putative NADP-dependent oxidoreductase YfmJ [Streptomyces lavendulae subsp. lavendulae]QUQ58769.1 Putative NADP-dependent oxidoreductase YfmJ [Streptomyces lavendulae subsp. lavendulae]